MDRKTKLQVLLIQFLTENDLVNPNIKISPNLRDDCDWTVKKFTISRNDSTTIYYAVVNKDGD